jgi:hypothetical protein
MLPQLLGEDSGPNQAVPMAALVDEVLRVLVVLLLVDAVLMLEVVAEVTLVELEDVEYEVEAWVVLDVTGSVAVAVTLAVGEKAEV